MAGNITVAGNITASVYYDRDNAAYYVDPNGAVSNVYGQWYFTNSSGGWGIDMTVNTPGGYGIYAHDPGGLANAGALANGGWGIYGRGIYGGGYVSDGGGACVTYFSYAGYGGYSSCPYGFASDARLKTDIKSLSTALDTVMKLNPVSFHWKEGSDQAMAHKELQYGLIAQEVKEVLPEIVGEFDAGKRPSLPGQKEETKSLNQRLGKTYAVTYEALIPVALAAIKEIKATLDALSERVSGNDKSIAALRTAVEELRVSNAHLRDENTDMMRRLDALEARSGSKGFK